MRLLIAFLSIALVVMGVLLFRQHAEYATTVQHLQVMTGDLDRTRATLQTTSAMLRAVQAERDELAARGNVITQLQLDVELSCAAHSATSTTQKVVSLVTLAKPDGSSIRLVDDTLDQPVRVSGDHADVTFEYRPLHEPDVIGHQIDELREITTLGVRYDGVLRALDLELQDVSRVILTINEIPTLDLTHLGIPARATGSDFATLDVSQAFRDIRAAYTRAVQARMQAHAN